MLAPWKKNYDKHRQCIKKRRHHIVTKVHIVKAMVFPVVTYGYESWTIKKARAEELTLSNCGSREDLKESGRSNQSILNHPWIFIGRTDVEAETPKLWPPDAKNWLIGKDPDAGKDWKQEMGTTEDEMVGWHHRLDGHELEQALEDSEGQGSLVCCSSWSHEESDTT